MNLRPFASRFGLPLLLLTLTPLPSLATCPPPPVTCEGWTRDSSHREVSLTGSRGCSGSCTGVCSTSPITALPSIRIGTLEHIVLGFSISNACDPECPSFSEPCFNIGVSYRWRVGSATEASTPPAACDPQDPEPLATGATFNASYLVGGSDNIVVSNAVYPDCGGPPTSVDVAATGTNLGIASQFQFSWTGDQISGWSLVGYTEARTYTKLQSPSTVHITVTNINYANGTFDVSAPDAVTPTLQASWGQVKAHYR